MSFVTFLPTGYTDRQQCNRAFAGPCHAKFWCGKGLDACWPGFPSFTLVCLIQKIPEQAWPWFPILASPRVPYQLGCVSLACRGNPPRFLGPDWVLISEPLASLE